MTQKAHSEMETMRPRVKDWIGEFAPEGWITRDGKFLPCDSEMLHGTIARFALGGQDAEMRAEKLGWLRISDYGDRATKELNQAQLNTLWDYCEAMNMPFGHVKKNIQIL